MMDVDEELKWLKGNRREFRKLCKEFEKEFKKAKRLL